MNTAELFSVSGRVALVTGGSRGIGKMITQGLIASGAKVYITARKVEACQATADEFGENCIAIPGDLSTLEGCQQLADELARREEKLDILINNAGAAWGAEFEDFPEIGWDKVMDLNVKSPFFLTQKLHGMLKNAASADRPAKVVNIASIDGLRINPWETYSYSASKAAMIHLTRRMALRLVKDNIYVTGIAPGAFPSEMNKAAKNAADVVARHIPNKRVGNAEDMAGAVLFLVSRAGDYVIGTTLPVDGGIVNASAPDGGTDPEGH